MSAPLGCPVSTLTGSTQSTGPMGPAGSDPGGGPRSATSDAGVGVGSGEPKRGGRRRQASGFRLGGPKWVWLLPFKS